MVGEKDTVPSLVRRFHEANESMQLPDFQWGEAFVVHIERDEEVGYQYTTFQLTSTGPAEKESKKNFKDSFLNKALLEESNALKLDQHLLENGSILRYEYQGTDFQLVPMALFSSPVGLLLIPYSDELLQEIFNRQFHLISGMVRECLFADLRHEFAVKQLKEIKSVEEIVKRFSATLARWLNPCDYVIYKDEEEIEKKDAWCDVFGKEEYQFELKVNFSSNNYRINFNLPSTWNPLPDNPKFIHELPESQMRLFKYKWGLLNFLESVYSNWKELKVDLLDSITSKAKDIKDELEVKIEELHKIKKDITTSSTIDTTLNRKAPFGFYRENRKWIIRFNDEDINFKIKSDQGMEAIRLLLENEGQHLPTLEMDEQLERAGYTYNKKSADQRIADPSLDEVNEQILLEEFNAYKKLEEEVRERSISDQAKYWQYLINIVNELNKYSHKRQYIQESKRIKRELDKLSVHEEFDENFRQLSSQVLKPSRKSGNEKNRKDSISKAIKTIIDLLKPFEDVHGYLSETIVRTNKGAHSPFIYVPELYSGEGFENIIWQTAI